MRFNQFSVILLLIAYSHLSAQTTYFIKYKENVSFASIEQKVQQNQFVPQGVPFQVQSDVRSVEYLAKGVARSTEILGRIIKVTFANDVDEGTFLQLQSLDQNIEYVQKAETYQINFTPNDSLLSQQWALDKIQAFNAWNKIQGTDSVRIGVIDTGIDYLHPDLLNKIWQNPGEIGTDVFGNDKRTNEIDDDNNGFVDDYRGWDFTDRVGFPFDSSGGDYLDWDNDPFDENNHGTYIAGIAAAQTNNITGIAGVAPNIQLVNLRAFDPGGYGEEDDVAAAILYAVENGVKV
ncbi:MAG: S8 family serine peptidase, partial [Ignavibacteriaceae bacterium]|nr:S8 family serine peptidase [Ignavibacteriaceae bacterium]